MDLKQIVFMRIQSIFTIFITNFLKYGPRTKLFQIGPAKIKFQVSKTI